jgi:GntR family transcriptional regulator
MDTSLDLKADLSRSSVPRYLQLATLFRGLIESGQWAAARQIPIVDDLSTQYGVARATIRQALGILEAEGLITRQRAKGTFVSERVKQHLWLEMTTNWRGLMNAREGAVIEVLKDEEVRSLPKRLHESGIPAESYRRLRRRHSRDGHIFLVADVFVEAEFYKLIPEAAFTTTTAMRLATFLPSKVGRAQQTITISAAGLEAAALLDLPLNAPVCLVDRSVTDERDRLVLLSKGIYRGDLVRMDMRLK